MIGGEAAGSAAPEGQRLLTQLVSEAGTEALLLLVIDQRELIRSCLTLWLGAMAPDFAVVGSDDIGHVGQPDIRRAHVALFSTVQSLPCKDPWLHRQIAALRVLRPDLPIALISELHAVTPVEAVAQCLHLTGYIPMSSSMELAAAALRVIIAGGQYIPPSWRNGEPLLMAAAAAAPQIAASPAASATPLTPRERVVLELLERGLANKVIGDRLGMSPSTVKAHVHNIFNKLNVHNRTEAAVARLAKSVGN